MNLFWIMCVVALVFSSVGFKKYIWFISIGYGLAVAGIGAMLLVLGGAKLGMGVVLACMLLVAYGLRLGGFLAYREFASGTYNTKMKGEVKDGTSMPPVAKVGIWVYASLLYAAETAPLSFRIARGLGADPALVVGMLISVVGLVIESLADLQKNAAKKTNPSRFVDTGLFSVVRCPNYFGEMLFWTGIFVGGVTACKGPVEWIVALLGYLGIIYVMFSGARRLELRQNRTYGTDPAYNKYVRTTPIMIPFVPLYSVARYSWLVA